MIAAHPSGHVAVTQPAHAWLSGQLARAWGNERFGTVTPREAVCLAAEQHDVGMAEHDLAPTLDVDRGLPTSFTDVDLDTHLRLWTEGPARLRAQSRHAALLASMHGSALYARRAAEPSVADFLARRRAFEAELRATLEESDQQIARNQRLLWTWDGLSLALILDWAPWTAPQVPAADGRAVALRLEAREDVRTLDPWPFEAERVVVGTEGRLLVERFSEQERLRQAMARAPWVDLAYELRPG
jgi:hypothetical protein